MAVFFVEIGKEVFVEGDTITDAINTYFDGQQINAPIVRVSHEMKLRNRFGAGKMVQNLRPEETDSYFQRMMAMIEIPSVSADGYRQKQPPFCRPPQLPAPV